MAGIEQRVIAENRVAFAQAEANFAAALTAAGVGTQAGLDRVGHEMVAALKRKLSQPGSGRVYRRRSVAHRASAPGEPPAVDTGRLRASMTHITGTEGSRRFLEVGTNVLYAPFLEFGTSKMPPRPFFRPVVLELQGQTSQVIARAIAAAQKETLGLLRHIRLAPE